MSNIHLEKKIGFILTVHSLFSDEEAGEESEDEGDKKRRKKRKAIRGQHKRWINKVVPYYYTPNVFSKLYPTTLQMSSVSCTLLLNSYFLCSQNRSVCKRPIHLHCD